MKSIKLPLSTLKLPNTLGFVAIGAVTGVVAGTAALITYGLLAGKSSAVALAAKNALALQNTSGTSSSASTILSLLLPASVGVVGGGATGLGVARKQVKQASEKFAQQTDELRQQLQTVETNLSSAKQAQSATTSREALEQIRGIGPKFSHLLQTVGIHSVDDLAQQTPEALRLLLEPEPSAAVQMFKLEDWILQAQQTVSKNA